jgi:hypothetical protein
MKITFVPASELRHDLSLLPRHYIESDLDRVTREWKERHPGKTVKVRATATGFTITLTETHRVGKNGQ